MIQPEPSKNIPVQQKQWTDSLEPKHKSVWYLKHGFWLQISYQKFCRSFSSETCLISQDLYVISSNFIYALKKSTK